MFTVLGILVALGIAIVCFSAIVAYYVFLAVGGVILLSTFLLSKYIADAYHLDPQAVFFFVAVPSVILGIVGLLQLQDQKAAKAEAVRKAKAEAALRALQAARRNKEEAERRHHTEKLARAGKVERWIRGMFG